MQIVNHGTNLAFATTMEAGGIDVTVGGGEFGQGYYTQFSRANAMAWAINRFPPSQNPCVLELQIQDDHYDGLNIKRLNLKDAKKLTKRLRNKKQTGTYTAGKDAIVGPLNGNPKREQQKFESSNAEDLLNGDDVTRTVI